MSEEPPITVYIQVHVGVSGQVPITMSSDTTLLPSDLRSMKVRLDTAARLKLSRTFEELEESGSRHIGVMLAGNATSHGGGS